MKRLPHANLFKKTNINEDNEAANRVYLSPPHKSRGKKRLLAPIATEAKEEEKSPNVLPILNRSVDNKRTERRSSYDNFLAVPLREVFYDFGGKLEILENISQELISRLKHNHGRQHQMRTAETNDHNDVMVSLLRLENKVDQQTLKAENFRSEVLETISTLSKKLDSVTFYANNNDSFSREIQTERVTMNHRREEVSDRTSLTEEISKHDIKGFQYIHFYMMGRNLNRMRRFSPQEYSFFPNTWVLPSDITPLIRAIAKSEVKTMISKPESSSQGKGIFLTKNLEDFKEDVHYVVQQYLENPLLIDGLKFDMRIYVLLAGCDPLKIYVYERGIARFATVPYTKPSPGNFNNLLMHLTNYAIQKKAPNYHCDGEGEDSKTGHKRCLSFIWQHLEQRGFNTANIKEEIHAIIIKTICSIQPIIAHTLKATMKEEFTNQSCFEILGFDILLDSKGKPGYWR